MINRDNYLAVQKYMEYLEHVRYNELNTIKRRRIQLRHLLEWADETPFANVAKIRPAFPLYLKQHRNDKRDQPLAQSTVVRSLTVAREFFLWLRRSAPTKCRAIDDRWIETLKASKNKQARTFEREIFTIEDVRKLITLPSELVRDWRDQAAIALLFLSGMRVGAFVTLTLECVNLETRSIKQWPGLGVRTKNSKAAITYLIDVPDLFAVVKRWDAYIREKLPNKALWFGTLNSDGTALTGAKVAGVERRAMVSKALKRLCDRAGIPYHSPHKLRHGFTVYALKSARTISELKAISQNLMHSSLTITDSIYGVLSGEDVASRIAGLGGSSKKNEGELIELFKRFLRENQL